MRSWRSENISNPHDLSFPDTAAVLLHSESSAYPAVPRFAFVPVSGQIVLPMFEVQAVSNLTPNRVKTYRPREPLAIRFEESTQRNQGRVMFGKCANGWCSATRHYDEGKLFRVDIDLGNMAGEYQQNTTYVWLCAQCAKEMAPKIEVAGGSVTVRLSKNPVLRGSDHPAARPN